VVIEKGSSFLMIKINTDPDIDFYKEHKSILDNVGFVWFCRFGKPNLRISSMDKSDNLVFIKDSLKNNNNTYIASFKNITTEKPANGFPYYYCSINKIMGIWFKLDSLVRVDHNKVNSNFVLTSSGGNLSNAYRSMCNSFYITNIKDIILNEPE